MPSLTITYTAPVGQRVATAYGKLQGWTNGGGAPRAATEEEIKQALIGVMKGWVRQAEYQVVAITDPELT